MAEFSRSDSVDELFANFSEEQYARAQDLMERRARETAPGETTPAPSARMGMFMPTPAPELRGRKNLAMFLERFYTWASATGCDSALDSEVVIKTSGTPRAELERLYNRALVDKSLRVWQSLTKALEKEEKVMKLVVEIGSSSVAWRALKKMVGETEDDAHDRAKREFETLQMDNSESVSEYFARVNIILMKLERYNITTSAREIKRVVMNSLTPRFPNETSILAMRGDFDLAELELGLIRVEKLRSESSRSAPSNALAVAHAGRGPTGTGGGTRGKGRKGRRSGGHHGDGRDRHQQGHPQMHHQQQQQQQQRPPAAMSQQTYAWQQQQQQQQPPAAMSQQSHAWQQHHQQPNPWSSWGRPPHQQQRGRAHHQRTPRHRGGHQAHRQRAMCQQCGKEEHFPADCVITMPAPAPHLNTAPFSGARAAQYGTGAHPAQQYSTGHVAQYGTHPLPTWTSPDSDTQSTHSAYGPPSNQASSAPASPMPPPPPISVGSPPPPASPSDSGWSFSSGPSQALQVQYVPPGKFSSSGLTDGRVDDDCVGGSYLPSAFVGQPVGVDQVNDVWIGDSGATTHMTRSAELMYDTKPPSPHRSRIILGDGSIRKVQFVGKLDLVFHSRTDYLVTLHDVSFVPDLGFNLFSFHVVQEKHEIILNKSGAHLLDGRLVFPRRRNGSSLRATRVMQGAHASANNALATFTDPPPPVQYRSVTSPVAQETLSTSSCRRGNAGAGMGVKSSVVTARKKGEESASVLSNSDGMAAAVLTPGGLSINKNKKRVVDINHYHVSLSHAHSSVLKATAQQHGIQLIGELAPCSGCSMAKGIRASTPHRTTSRAETPLDLVHIDTAGPFPESLGGSRYVVMFVDSASRFQRPYGTRDKSASAILGVVQRFVADMGVPRAFRTDNGTEYTNSAFVEYCNGLQIRRELTAPYTPQQNGPVESGLSRAIKAGHAARIEVNRLFPDVHLDKLKGVRDPDGTGLWMESVLWASEGFNRSATTANAGMLSPHEIFFGSRPPMPILPFCQPAYHRIPRHGKLERQARLCYFLNFGYNHGRDCIKIMDAETGRIVHSRDVTWHQPREPLVSAAPTVESEVPQSPSGVTMPGYIYIQPAPAATTAPAAAPVPASDNAAPAPPRQATEPIRDRVVRELGHEGDVRMPGRTRGETRAMRESPRSMGLMSHAALAQGIATREAFDEAFYEYGIPPPDADLPTAPASDVPTPSTVAEADSSEHAAIWRNSRTREFRGLLQANTFGPA